MKYKLKTCCDGLMYATSSGSDNEGYGQAIYFNKETGRIAIGCVGSAVTHCPFCGKKIKIEKLNTW